MARSASGVAPAKSRAPGATLAAYLGQDIPPSRWSAIMAPLDAAVDRCLAARGFGSDHTVVAVEDELRVADPAAHRQRFGFGVSESIRKQRSTATPPTGDSTARAQATVACDATVDRDAAIAQHVAPVAVMNRASELVARHSAEPATATAVRAWQACMRTAGVDGTADVTPDDAEQLTYRRAVSMAAGRTRTGGAATESPLALTDAELDVLQGFELDVARNDDACRISSGYDSASRAVERQVLAELKAEFPSFKGKHPLGRVAR